MYCSLLSLSATEKVVWSYLFRMSILRSMRMSIHRWSLNRSIPRYLPFWKGLLFQLGSLDDQWSPGIRTCLRHKCPDLHRPPLDRSYLRPNTLALLQSLYKIQKT